MPGRKPGRGDAAGGRPGGPADGEAVPGQPRGGTARSADGGAEAREGPTRRPDDEAEAPAYSAVCDLCGTMMYGRHCKLVCRQCGYVRDCSDP